MTESKEGPIVTLDGPAGSGKSSTAKAVAQALGFRHLDSGALYRAITVGLLRSDHPKERWTGLGADDFAALGVNIEPVDEGFRVYVGGEEVRDELRTDEVTDLVSQVARVPGVRASLLRLQRAAGSRGRLVADGRDMGTVVFPDAEVKVFLVADVAERARRRLLEGEAVAVPEPSDLTRQMDALTQRDRRDSEREVSPLKRAPDAHQIDTTGMSFENQVKAVISLVESVDDTPHHV